MKGEKSIQRSLNVASSIEAIVIKTPSSKEKNMNSWTLIELGVKLLVLNKKNSIFLTNRFAITCDYHM